MLSCVSYGMLRHFSFGTDACACPALLDNIAMADLVSAFFFFWHGQRSALVSECDPC